MATASLQHEPMPPPPGGPFPTGGPQPGGPPFGWPDVSDVFDTTRGASTTFSNDPGFPDVKPGPVTRNTVTPAPSTTSQSDALSAAPSTILSGRPDDTATTATQESPGISRSASTDPKGNITTTSGLGGQSAGASDTNTTSIGFGERLSTSLVTSSSGGSTIVFATTIPIGNPLINGNDDTLDPIARNPALPQEDEQAHNGFFKRPGAAAGAFIAAFLALGAIIWMIILIRRHRRDVKGSIHRPYRTRSTYGSAETTRRSRSRTIRDSNETDNWARPFNTRWEASNYTGTDGSVRRPSTETPSVYEFENPELGRIHQTASLGRSLHVPQVPQPLIDVPATLQASSAEVPPVPPRSPLRPSIPSSGGFISHLPPLNKGKDLQIDTEITEVNRFPSSVLLPSLLPRPLQPTVLSNSTTRQRSSHTEDMVHAEGQTSASSSSWTHYSSHNSSGDQETDLSGSGAVSQTSPEEEDLKNPFDDGEEVSPSSAGDHSYAHTRTLGEARLTLNEGRRNSIGKRAIPLLQTPVRPNSIEIKLHRKSGNGLPLHDENMIDSRHSRRSLAPSEENIFYYDQREWSSRQSAVGALEVLTDTSSTYDSDGVGLAR